MSNADLLETEIQGSLETICAHPNELSWTGTTWTREVKEAIGRVAKSLGFLWYASGASNADCGEWLWDGTAWKDRGGWVVSVPLVLESEWGNVKEVLDDFQKLLVARAEHRVMVFSHYTRAEAEALIAQMIDVIQSCGLSCSGDRYLLACWCNDSRRFLFRNYVV